MRITNNKIKQYNNLVQHIIVNFDHMFYFSFSELKIEEFKKLKRDKVSDQMKHHFFIAVDILRHFIVEWIVKEKLYKRIDFITHYDKDQDVCEAFSHLEDFTIEVKKLNLFEL